MTLASKCLPFLSKLSSLPVSAAMPTSWITTKSFAPGTGKPFLAQSAAASIRPSSPDSWARDPESLRTRR